jgi:hypothetical protein
VSLVLTASRAYHPGEIRLASERNIVMAATSGPQGDLPAQFDSQGSNRLIADIHLSEYQAISSRLTYWVTLQFATYTVAVVFLGIFQTLTGIYAVWAGFFVLQLMAWAWLQTSCEIFMHVLYTEERLKPRIQRLVLNEPFWRYEPFLTEIRSKGFVWFEWRFGLAVPYLAALGVMVWLVAAKVAHPWQASDWLWAAIIVYVSCMAILKFIQASGLQKRMDKLA